jgi:hypothetical protein
MSATFSKMRYTLMNSSYADNPCRIRGIPTRRRRVGFFIGRYKGDMDHLL